MEKKYTLLLKYERNDVQDICAIIHGPNEIPLVNLNRQLQSDILEMDINVLSVALFTAIRAGKDLGVVDPFATIDNIINYAKQQYSGIEQGIMQDVPDDLRELVAKTKN